jgi:ubiquinone/menaquinone biosynthesis C-methylase UbiE
MISSINSRSTHAFLQRHLAGQSDKIGLHLASGEGAETFFIANILGENGQVTGIEKDEVMIEKARHKISESGCGVQFFPSQHYNWIQKNYCDFVYFPIYPSWLPMKAELIQGIRECLKPGGKLLIEIQRLSNFRRYPYNHAFARSVELLGLLEAEYTDFPVDDVKQLSELFQNAGFRVAEHECIQPFFIGSQYNNIISLSLEVCSEQIIAFGLSSQVEINALLVELKYCETKQDTLISSNGMTQIKVYKK